MAEMCFQNMEAFAEKEDDGTVTIDGREQQKGFTCWQSLKQKFTGILGRFSTQKSNTEETNVTN